MVLFDQILYYLPMFDAVLVSGLDDEEEKKGWLVREGDKNDTTEK